MSAAPEWRPMRREHLASVLALANAVHEGLPESEAVFAERLRLFPRGCLVLAGDETIDGYAVDGYAVSHPIRRFEPPALNTMLGTLPAGADDYYIHDVVVAPSRRGDGHAAKGVNRLLDIAGGYETASLISVYGTAGFWSRFGFVAASECMKNKLLAYGADALYMIRRAGKPAQRTPSSCPKDASSH